MAEAVVSTILGQLATILRQQGDANVRLVVGVDEQVKKLTSNFRAIQAVLEDAECKQVKDKAVRDWLDKLKDVSYDVDDVLDEWNTAIQKLRGLNRTEELDQNASKLVTKVCSLISCCRIGSSSRILRHDIAKKIKDLNKVVDVIAAEKNSFNWSSTKGSGEVEQQITTSVVDSTEIHGRDHEKKEITNLLLSESSHGTRSLPIISIVGLRGIGKTTLARLVFNHHEVTTHFEIKIWVCVSNPFDEIRIAKAILESVKGVAPNVNEHETLLEQIRKLLKYKKFLLVLDDVWTEDSRKWEQLKNTLRCGLKGSRILVTTRESNVAEILGTTNMFQLGTLSAEKSWAFFCQVALVERSSKEREKLENTGRKIVGKCKGLPIAVKTLGSLLRYKSRLEEWQSVLDSEMWELEDAEKGIFPPLLLSYFDLPSELKKCFSYCAIFPKDHVIEKENLIQLWMSQGFLRAKYDKDLELIGEEYFEKLVTRSLFQDFEKSEIDGSIIRCKMHDMVHDFAQYLTINECFNVELGVLEHSSLKSHFGKARHCTIVLTGNASFPMSVHKKNRLHTLRVNSRNLDREINSSSKAFDQLTCLRALELNYKVAFISSSINKLIHLRYLNISSSSSLVKLPETLCELYNLQTLNISKTLADIRVPEGIGKLVNLRHLINYSNSSFGNFYAMPKGIEELTCLRTLSCVTVKDGDQFCNYESGDQFCNFGSLKNLNHLRGSLTMTCLEMADLGKINDAELKNKKNLQELSLRCKWASNEGALEDFQPPPNLVKLEIVDFWGNGPNKFWSWVFSLNKLRVLRLENWPTYTQLPPLGKLSSLETLYISGFKSVERVGDEFLGLESDDINMPCNSSSVIVFPKLQSLEFCKMNNWREWSCENTRRGAGDTTVMPRLRSLKFSSCGDLITLPDYILQLTTLEEFSGLWLRYEVEEVDAKLRIIDRFKSVNIPTTQRHALPSVDRTI